MGAICAILIALASIEVKASATRGTNAASKPKPAAAARAAAGSVKPKLKKKPNRVTKLVQKFEKLASASSYQRVAKKVVRKIRSTGFGLKANKYGRSDRTSSRAMGS